MCSKKKINSFDFRGSGEIFGIFPLPISLMNSYNIEGNRQETDTSLPNAIIPFESVILPTSLSSTRRVTNNRFIYIAKKTITKICNCSYPYS